MKASKAIQLVLIGSAAILLACVGCGDGKNQSTTTQPAGRHGGWYGWWGGGSRRSSGGSAITHSPRGGFGSSGHHAGS